ncbi:Cu-oxidase-domain-containing protein [Mycena alexandri]|uniref:Cu-oxidase-domain-containing protein n=1 Tax=Mycena alexandri TaxID=1745969 RepID=A0AAD6WYF6_9AGAR|nr:Cu-oxidase-domain-containing protein [Mycena alexandri]
MSSSLSSPMMQFLLALPALLAAMKANAGAASPIKEYTLDIVNGPVSPDGFTRIGVLANGTFPGPPMLVTKGDTLRVTVNNKLTDNSMRLSTSIDFDGIFTNTDNVFNEGSPFVTTCPFGPGASYTYEVPLGNQTGSYWYHSQLSVQYADGLRGVVVIYDPEDAQAHLYDVDDESTIWTVADWWHNTSVSGLAGYLATQIIPVADSGLFNAAGRYNTGPLTPYAVQTVTKGTRYRFRIINISARSDFTISIDNHTMTVIETDGTPTSPLEVNVLDVLVGQRYSVVVTADQPIGNYWINSILGGGNPAHNSNLNVTLGRGILRYEGAPAVEPSGPMTLGPAVPNALVESNLHPLVPIPAPEPDYNLTFVTNMPAGQTVWQINGIAYISPVVPTLVKILDGASTDADFNQTENTFVFPANKVIQVTFPPDPANELHPFHLHGNNFWVVKSNATETINTVDPIRRDVAGTASGGMILRFTTDKPGPWFFHCHIFYHFVAGLGSVIVGGPDEIRQQVHPTEGWDALCPAYNALPANEQR